jgi:threonine/homoserine/homoserine lactone efflux protein
MTVASVSVLFLLGLTMSAAPGALNVETVRRGVRHGFSAALTVQVGALLGDAVWVAATLVGVALGLQTTQALPACLLLGGAVMLWTAWHIMWPRAEPRAGDGPPHRHRGLALGAALALSSPLTVVFWAAVTGMVRQDLGRSATTTELALIGAAYVCSVLVWALGLSVVAAWGRRLVRPGTTRLLNVGCAALMALWGAQLIGRAAGVLA